MSWCCYSIGWVLLHTRHACALQAEVACTAVAPLNRYSASGSVFALAISMHHPGGSDSSWSIIEFVAPSAIPFAVHACPEGRPLALGYVGTHRTSTDARSVLVCLSQTHSIRVLSDEPLATFASELKPVTEARTPFTAMYGAAASEPKKRKRDEEALAPRTEAVTSASMFPDTTTHELGDVTALLSALMPKFLQPCGGEPAARGSARDVAAAAPSPSTAAAPARSDAVSVAPEAVVEEFVPFFAAMFAGTM